MLHETIDNLDVFYDLDNLRGGVIVTGRRGTEVVYKERFFGYTWEEIDFIVRGDLKRLTN